MNTTYLTGLTIHAVNGTLGTVDQTYFDDETWCIRYITVKTGGWLSGREVLISPVSICRTDLPAKRLYVILTKRQVEESPEIDMQQPVSRQQETAFLGYYGYPYYWGGPYLWGSGFFPEENSLPAVDASLPVASRLLGKPTDCHLRSAGIVTGYRIEALDGELGHVNHFVMDDRTWAIRYVEVATRNWWPGKKVLISPEWIERVSWPEARVCVGLTQEAISSAPEYAGSIPITREYEEQLHAHYSRSPYWLNNKTSTKPLLLAAHSSPGGFR